MPRERRLRDDVVGRAGLEHADRDHRRVQRIDVARDDRLDLVDDLRAHQDRVDGEVRPRRVPPRPSISMVMRSAAAISGPGRMANSPTGRPGIIVHAVDFLDAEAVHQAVLDHGLAAGAALLGRLEDHHRGAGEVARLGEVARGAEQHGGVAVVAAGVHLAGHRRLVGTSFASSIGSASMSARSPITRPARRPCRRGSRRPRRCGRSRSPPRRSRSS